MIPPNRTRTSKRNENSNNAEEEEEEEDEGGGPSNDHRRRRRFESKASSTSSSSSSSSSSKSKSTNYYNSDEPIDPTTLAISIIPLIPSKLTSHNNSIQTTTEQSSSSTATTLSRGNKNSINLPSLAASLSTLPHNVLNVINVLTQELKSSREQSILNGDSLRSFKDLNLLGSDCSSMRENREKWLESQKMNHLKKSIGSLTNLHSTLQSKHLKTLETLSNLQKNHESTMDSLRFERDGVRAVNKVLKLKILKLENRLEDCKRIMDCVVEKVEIVEVRNKKVDWSVLDHGIIDVYQPIQSKTNRIDDQCPLNNSNQLTTDATTAKNLHSPISLTNDHGNLSKSQEPQSKRSINLIAELTEELENIRREIKVELDQKNEEIQGLRKGLRLRESEIKGVMKNLNHFMGLDGFYVRTDLEDDPDRDESYLEKFQDSNETPRPKQKRSTRYYGNDESKIKIDRGRLEDEIRELESVLKKNRRSTIRKDDRVDRKKNLMKGKTKGFGNSFSATASSISSNNEMENDEEGYGSKDDLKLKYRKVCGERDRLKNLLTSIDKKSTKGNGNKDGGRIEEAERVEEGGRNELIEVIKELKIRLDNWKSESDRLNYLLKASENQVQELESRLNRQELEFEDVAERVQIKLKEQRNKILESKIRIEELEKEVLRYKKVLKKNRKRRKMKDEDEDSQDQDERQSKSSDHKSCEDESKSLGSNQEEEDEDEDDKKEEEGNRNDERVKKQIEQDHENDDQK